MTNAADYAPGILSKQAQTAIDSMGSGEHLIIVDIVSARSLSRANPRRVFELVCSDPITAAETVIRRMPVRECGHLGRKFTWEEEAAAGDDTFNLPPVIKAFRRATPCIPKIVIPRGAFAETEGSAGVVLGIVTDDIYARFSLTKG